MPTPTTSRQLPPSTTMDYHTQILPIRYSGRKRLETYLREVLGSSDFIIEGYLYEQWTIKVPQLLSDAQIETLKAKARNNHYAQN
ncbi:hypothetical protein F4860DRAFT_243194 [Xylaria cubensis]|nr:hypothetical protein F4860DRAFT_243194 [Xylaria cubensis]